MARNQQNNSAQPTYDVPNILEGVRQQVLAYAAEMQKADRELADLRTKRREQYETWATDYSKKLQQQLAKDIHDLELKGIIQNETQKFQYAEKLMRDQQANRLKAEIDFLRQTSEAGKKQQEKDLKVLQHKKKILELEAKVADARAKGDKDAEKKAKKELGQARREQTGTSKDGMQEGLKNAFSDLNRQLEEGTAVQETAAQNTQTALKSVGKAITEGLNQINNSISAYAKHQTAVNARLQGVSSYSEIADNLNAIAFSPLLKAEDLYNNVAELASQGIVTNIEQRAMFMTLKDGIATTFDVTSDSLRRIIRLQQNDSTAARLGLEAYLTEFLNVYVENTEYLQSTFDSVSASLLEASAMLKYNNDDVGDSLEFEYQVQKWLGTLTGLGLSDEAAQNIAAAIGQLGSGDVDSLSGSNLNNLLIMGANKAGNISYADVLSGGLNSNQVNDLMFGVVKYMQEIATNSSSNVVKTQLGKTFGLNVSDLIAATNLNEEDLAELRGESTALTYENMYGELEEQFDQLPSRIGISNILDNLFENLTYQTGANIAKNPALFAMWKITDLLKNATGGNDIALPFINAFGTGLDLNTGVANLMQMAIAGGSLLGNIGSIIGGIGSAVNGSSLLSKLSVSLSGAEIKEVGSGFGGGGNNRKSGDDNSAASYVGNTDGSTYQDSAVNDASDSAQKELDQKVEEYDDPVVKYLDEEVELKDKLEDITGTLLLMHTSLSNMSHSLSSVVAKATGATEGGDGGAGSGSQQHSIPKGETSALSGDKSSEGGVDSANSNDTTLNTLNMTGYIVSEEFTTDLKSIVTNVAKLAGENTAQEWNNPATGSASTDFSNAPKVDNSASSDIEGLTQFTPTNSYMYNLAI